MPTYEYFCEIHGEFEEIHSISTVLTHCPKCKEEGKDTVVKRLISFATPGTVELYGQDLVDKVKADTKQLKKEIYGSEQKYANFIGQDHYQKLQTKMDKRKRDKY